MFLIYRHHSAYVCKYFPWKVYVLSLISQIFFELFYNECNDYQSIIVINFQQIKSEHEAFVSIIQSTFTSIMCIQSRCLEIPHRTKYVVNAMKTLDQISANKILSNDIPKTIKLVADDYKNDMISSY